MSIEKAFSDLVKHILNGGDIVPELLMELAVRHHVSVALLVDCISNRLSFDTSFLRNHSINGRNAMRMPSLVFYATEAKKACAQFHKSRNIVNPGYLLLRYASALLHFDLTVGSLFKKIRTALWSFDGVPVEKVAEKDREAVTRAVETARNHVQTKHGQSASGKLILQCLLVLDHMVRAMPSLPAVPTVKHSENGSIVRLLCDFADSRVLKMLAEEKLQAHSLGTAERHRLLKFIGQCITDCSFPLFLSLDYTRENIVFSESALVAACKSLL